MSSLLINLQIPSPVLVMISSMSVPVSCRLDYCTSLLYGIADSQLRRLQSVQNAAARLMTGTGRTELITPVLQSMHWFCTSWRYWSTSASMGMHLSTWQMTAAWSAAAGPVLDRRRQRPNWRFHRPERRLATDLLPSTDHVCGTVYRHPFATRHWHSLFSATDSNPISLNNGCGVCDF